MALIALLVLGCAPTLNQPGGGFVDWDARSDATSVVERRCHSPVRLIDKRKGYSPQDYRCEASVLNEGLVARVSWAGAECWATFGDTNLRQRDWQQFLERWQNKSGVEIIVNADQGADCASAFGKAAEAAHFTRVSITVQPIPKLM